MRKKRGKGRKRKDKMGQERGTKKGKGKWERRKDKEGMGMGNRKWERGQWKGEGKSRERKWRGKEWERGDNAFISGSENAISHYIGMVGGGG